MTRKTKIVATIGPTSSTKEVLKSMIAEGLNVVRLNFSHGTHEDHEAVVRAVREIDAELGINTSLLADLQGPKLRVGEMENNGVLLESGSVITITTEKQIGTSKFIYTNYSSFPADVKAGERVLMDDGKLVVKILETDGKKEVKCEVIQGGILSSKKGLNLPETKVSLPFFQRKTLLIWILH